MSFQGFFDKVDSNGVVGWARDPLQPDHKVTVEVFLDGKPRGEGVANHFRPDLRDNGIGDGYYAFYIDFENGPIYGDTPLEVKIRFKGTDVYLDGGPRIMEPAKFRYVAMDIVNNCNLRCPFCLYDYGNTKATHRMQPAVYEKILQLIPHVPRGEFWLSCLHEPSLHPDFLTFIEMIPEEFRKKAFFTSNFSRKLNDEYLVRLADSNIQHINISVDSLNPELYPILRKGSRLDQLLENLVRLKQAFSQNSRSPNIRFITMVFKTNIDEIETIVNRCSDEFGGVEHELRYPYKVPHITDDFRNTHFLENNRWGEVKSIVSGIAKPTLFDAPNDDYAARVYDPIEYYASRDPFKPKVEPRVPDRPFGIRFSANGDGRIEDLEEHFHFNVGMVNDVPTLLNCF